MMLKTADHFPNIRPVLIPILAVLLGFYACARKENKEEVAQSDRGNLESDFAGKVRVMLASGINNPEDSIRVAQYIYQMASLETEIYKLQNALIKSYISACDVRCERHKCGDGDIISAAMAYYLDGQLDSADILMSMRDPKAKTAREADEIAGIISSKAREGDAFTGLYDSGKIRTPAAIAFLAVTAIDHGASASEWLGKLEKIKSNLPDLAYAKAYAMAVQGKVVDSWQTLPDFAPLSRIFPDPSFIDIASREGEDSQRKIFLPLGLYIRMRVDEALLSAVLAWNYDQTFQPDINALEALSKIKGLVKGNPRIPALAEIEHGSYGPKEELLFSLEYSERDSIGYAWGLDSLVYPVSRAAYFDLISSRKQAIDGLEQLLLAEIDSSRQHVIWESRVFLSLALLNIVPPGQAFKILSNFGVSDLSVRNNSPEWLAIYARSGLEEASQLSLTSQVIYNLSQHYPYAIGLYELVQSYNHLCKYY